jgi:hypothetical protein
VGVSKSEWEAEVTGFSDIVFLQTRSSGPAGRDVRERGHQRHRHQSRGGESIVYMCLLVLFAALSDTDVRQALAELRAKEAEYYRSVKTVEMKRIERAAHKMTALSLDQKKERDEIYKNQEAPAKRRIRAFELEQREVFKRKVGERKQRGARECQVAARALTSMCDRVYRRTRVGRN